MIVHQRKLFGIKFDVERVNPAGLPLYLKAGRSFWIYSFSGMDFILVTIPNDEKFGVIALENNVHYSKPGLKNLSHLVFLI